MSENTPISNDSGANNAYSTAWDTLYQSLPKAIQHKVMMRLENDPEVTAFAKAVIALAEQDDK
jgi:hypothetical protein